MCLMLYIGSRQMLPLVARHAVDPVFGVRSLKGEEARVHQHLETPYVACAESHTGCGCGFNQCRQYDVFSEEDIEVRDAALKSCAELVRYCLMNGVERVYTCWAGEEVAPKKYHRRVPTKRLAETGFYFKEGELLNLSP